MESSRRLEGRRIVLTGASGGLGQMLARGFVDNGAQVALVGRRHEPLDELASKLGGTTTVVVGDTSIEEDNDWIAAEVSSQWGGVDVWVANAGISPVVKKPTEMTAQDFRSVIETNLVGSFLGARAALRVMTEGGRVIMTSSVIGQRPRRGFSAYSASKAGMEGLVRSLAIDVAHQGITVNAVAPGWFDSPLAEPWMTNPERAAQILSHVPMGRWGVERDLVGAFVFLASEESSFVTGAVLPVDGGYLLQ